MIPLVRDVPVGARVVGYQVEEEFFDSFAEAYERAKVVVVTGHAIDIVYPVWR